MPSIRVEIEIALTGEAAGAAVRVAHQLREALGLTVPVHVVQPGTLPRFEMKSVRFVVEA
jgi:phenylacetate-coenzyme A ligase PaaK-like adenylate-forming protein